MFEAFLVKSTIDRLTKESKQAGLPVKLHIGCGANYFKGWINIDNNSDHNIRKLDLNWDLRMPMPFEDGSIDFIYHEHFLEHLTVEQGRSAIKDFMRTLKPGGVMRIAMPDLEMCMKEYLNPDWKNNPVLKKWGLGHVQTKAELLNIYFRSWGHKWLYDSEELARRLKDAGCFNIKQCDFRQSDYTDLQNLEIRDESVLIMEVIK